ncbi:MAG: gliding motility protein GldN [Flavobacteriaceae bacterium]
MNKCIFISILFFAFATSFAQINVLNADSPEEIGVMSEEQKKAQSDKKFLEYPFIEEKDIMWSKIVYEEIDLSEKFNQPLFFPKDGLYRSERKSLWRTIREAILAGKISNIYNDANANFTEKFDRDTYLKRLENREGPEVVPLKSMDIVSYKIKGIWYVDKRIGEMRFRLLGIMPHGKDMNNLSSDEPVDLFWLWYKDLRPILHEQLVFDDNNNVSRITFDQLLTSRRFTSRIYAVDNVFNDRPVDQYVGDPFMQLIESERLKNVIRDFEQDLWAN